MISDTVIDSDLLKRHPFLKYAEELHNCPEKGKTFLHFWVVYKSKFFKTESLWYLDDSGGNSFQIFYCPHCGKELGK